MMNTNPSPSLPMALPPLPELRGTTVFGRKIFYYDVGSGPTLVLVHALGGDADQWPYCFKDLSANHRVVALELLGFGRSDKPTITYRIAGFVEVLEGFLKALGIEHASFLGHSLGGWIVAAFALQFPDKVDKLILNDACGIDSGAIKPPVDLNISTHVHMRDMLESMFYDKSLVTNELVDLAYSLHLERNDGPTIRSILESFSNLDEKLDRNISELTSDFASMGRTGRHYSVGAGAQLPAAYPRLWGSKQFRSVGISPASKSRTNSSDGSWNSCR